MSGTRVLVLNSGSSSVKYQLLDMRDSSRLAVGIVERIGEQTSRVKHTLLATGESRERFGPIADHDAALKSVAEELSRDGLGLDSSALLAIGHRVVHGGKSFTEPTVIEPWVNMDYGPSLVNTYEIGSDGSNFAYKGIAVRLDPGAGGVSRGNAWLIFDHDTFRVAAAWTADATKPDERFIDWNGIQFNGMHQVHPRIVGQVQFANPTGPGWADPRTGSFADDQRVLGRDGRRYGPLPRAWARFRGAYAHGDKTIIRYSVGTTEVLEMPGLIESTPILGTPQQAAPPVFTRS